MSETDDTDYLLAISPTFFNSKIEDSNEMELPSCFPYLQPSQQQELKNLNEKLKELEKSLPILSASPSNEIVGTNSWDISHSTPKHGIFDDKIQSPKETYRIDADGFKLPKIPEETPSKSELLSLSQIWASDNFLQNTTASIQEERLRREHCERKIQQLQTKILEYQQKLSVAITVDRTKDEVLRASEEEKNRLKIDLSRHEVCEKYQTDLKSRIENLEKELSQAVNLATKFQSKNEILEQKVESILQTTGEMEELYKHKIEDLEGQVNHCRKNLKYCEEDLKSTREKLVCVQSEADKVMEEQLKCDKVIQNLERLKSSSSTELLNEKRKINQLEKQNQEINEKLVNIMRREKNLQQELDQQKHTLKSHYQQQLENVVKDKLVQFQEELDKTEATLKAESKQREHLIAERAIKQISLISEKSDQEIQLIHEKHEEEIDLYRIQLADATKRISDLEGKINCYRTKRCDLAEKLHEVMDTQWKKALEILLSPSKLAIKVDGVDPEVLDGVASIKPENESFESPKSSRMKSRKPKDDYKKAQQLQNYIEILLNKSPRDLEALDKFLNDFRDEQKKSSTSPPKNSKSHPPWK
ncbi:CNTROB family protein [Megaselia abdita]